MKIFTLRSEQCLPIPINEAWDFFSSPGNLSKITPPEMGFVILTELKDAPIFNGMEIAYTVRPLLNIPVKWVTLIQDVKAPFVFKDTQLKGPYALWEHTHTFTQVRGGIKMTDEVKYALPFGPIGVLAHAVLVRKKLATIFKFREAKLKQLFGEFGK